MQWTGQFITLANLSATRAGILFLDSDSSTRQHKGGTAELESAGKPWGGLTDPTPWREACESFGQ